MNSTINFDNERLFEIAITTLEMDATPPYEIDEDTLTISTEHAEEIVEILHDNGIFKFKCFLANEELEYDQFRSDAEADADALASAGYGTDEDYSHFGETDYEE